MIRFIRNWTKKHPKITYTFYLFVMVIFLSEIALRIFVRWDPAYYVGFSDPAPNSVVEYPYGIIKYNSDGFADDEFEKIKTRPRIAYLGDSVCYGVGAGYGYRISELLENAYPEYAHLNLSGGLDTGMSMDMAERYLQLAERFDVDVAVYLMNLNDIGPYFAGPADQRLAVFRFGALFDWLRGKSYLYTYLRLAVKNTMVRLGYTQSGQKQFELYPDECRDEFEATADRVNSVGRRLREHGIGFVVVILPYEMQISREAAETYQQLGIGWGESFLDRGPQKLLIDLLSEAIVIDGYNAFIDREHAAADWNAYGVGECFVYNRGDKIDWNHPNRKGHRLLADFIARTGVLPAAMKQRRPASSDSQTSETAPTGEE
jgi:hypothetical protein